MLNRVLNERYRIVRKVGSGGMADVYEAFDLVEEGRIVAIKVLKPEYSSDPQYLRRLSREAQAMVSLKNDHVVSLFDMGTDGDIHYLVLEYVDGRTLREYMDEVGKLEPQEAVAIVCDVLDGLAHAHKRGLIHRDVKPQNIMMTEEGVIKLTDFGIAKFAGSTTKTYEGGEAMGSVFYISPEQAKGELVDAQADLYSVGVMLYEMLAGEPPFSGENAVQVALKHINDDIKPLHEVDDKISIALSDVVARATVKDRSIRYSSAEVMRNDLRRALKNPLSRFAKIRRDELKNLSEGEGQNEEVKKGFIREHFNEVIHSFSISIREIPMESNIFIWNLVNNYYYFIICCAALGIPTFAIIINNDIVFIICVCSINSFYRELRRNILTGKSSNSLYCSPT